MLYKGRFISQAMTLTGQGLKLVQGDLRLHEFPSATSQSLQDLKAFVCNLQEDLN